MGVVDSRLVGNERRVRGTDGKGKGRLGETERNSSGSSISFVSLKRKSVIQICVLSKQRINELDFSVCVFQFSRFNSNCVEIVWSEIEIK